MTKGGGQAGLTKSKGTDNPQIKGVKKLQIHQQNVDKGKEKKQGPGKGRVPAR